MTENQKDNAINFTVAIPTYNGGRRLAKVLEKLQTQINTEDISWEILVIDNNSRDNTEQIIREYQANWNKSFPLKYCLELKQGAAWARKRAIQEANAPLIGFIDDDNLPAPNWVNAAYTFGKEHPKAGAYGSQIHGEYEIEPPPNFERIKAFLAITERGINPLLYNPKSKLLPPAAGLVVRKEAWVSSVPEKCILSGRVPGSMLTGEDLEVLAYIRQSDWEIWYNPTMEINHQIPASRLNKDYLIALMGGIGLSRYVTRMIGVKSWQKLILTLAYLVNDLRKIIVHCLKYGMFVETDVVAACERELLIKTLISPFYLSTTRILKLNHFFIKI